MEVFGFWFAELGVVIYNGAMGINKSFGWPGIALLEKTAGVQERGVTSTL